MIVGQPKFNGIHVAIVKIDRTGTTISMEAKAAFCGVESGMTHGWTNGTTWSPATMAKLGELFASIEQDLAGLHFDGGGSPATASATVTAGTAADQKEPGGVSEWLGNKSDDAQPL